MNFINASTLAGATQRHEKCKTFFYDTCSNRNRSFISHSRYRRFSYCLHDDEL